MDKIEIGMGGIKKRNNYGAELLFDRKPIRCEMC